MKSDKRDLTPVGADWASTKLAILAEYLERYTSALKKQHLAVEYIDACAGTGYKTLKEKSGLLLFPDLIEEEPRGFLEGSARVALQNPRPFDRYVFVDKSPERERDLEKLMGEFPERASKVEITTTDGSTFCRGLPGRSWSYRRAVMLLDPYAAQADWKSVEAIARTASIDLWIFLPLGVALLSLLTKTGQRRKSWEDKLDAFLGGTEWREAVYASRVDRDTFGEVSEESIRAGVARIAGFLQERLRSCFADVASTPKTLFNSRNCPLYLVSFAAGNPVGADVAVRMAESIVLRKI